MTGSIILLAVLAAVYLIPLRLLAQYSGEGPVLAAGIGPIRIPILPREKKAQGEKPPKKGKKEKKKKEKETEESEPPQGAEKKKKGSSLGGKLTLFRELISLGLEALGVLRRRLRVESLTVRLTVGAKGRDPGDSALLYGRGWAALGALIPLLERALVIQHRDMQVLLSDQESEHLVYANGVIRIFLGELLILGLFYGLRALKSFLFYKMKGGKANGTSNQ